MKYMKMLAVIAVAATILLLTTCEKGTVNDSTLELKTYLGSGERISYTNIPLDFIPDSGIKTDGDYTFTVVAEIAAPNHSNGSLGATDIKAVNGKLAVSYNIAGETYGGAIDTYSMNFDDNSFALTALDLGIFSASDINALAWVDSKLFACGAADLAHTSITTPAMLYHIDFGSNSLNLKQTIDLPSYAGNSVVGYGDNLYVSSGNTGGISTFTGLASTPLTATDYYAASNLRSVSADENGNLFALKVDPVDLLVNAGGSWSTQTIGSGIQAEAKSVLQVKYNHSFLALNNLGTKVLYNGDFSTVGTLDPSDVAHTSSDERVANGLCVGERKVIIASGASGVEIVHLNDDMSPSLLGNVIVNHSVNMVEILQEYTDPTTNSNVGYFAIASGSGGIRIVKMVDTSEPIKGTLTDSRDGQSYATVKIGGVWWMAENLNYGTYINDFQNIPTGIVKTAYNQTIENCEIYGGLYHGGLLRDRYTWPETNSGHCPQGWHLPSTDEWSELEISLGMNVDTDEKRQKVAELLLAKNAINGTVGTGFSGFNALAVGTAVYSELMGGQEVEFGGFNEWTTFWGYNADSYNDDDERIGNRSISNTIATTDYRFFTRNAWFKSIRCVKN